jgi:hypothetical protein
MPPETTDHTFDFLGRCTRCGKSRITLVDDISLPCVPFDEKSRTTAKPDPWGYDEHPNPRAFVQWKGTDVCMDFHCDCGADCHFDGYFAYVVECPHCHSQWQMPFNLFPRKFEGAVKAAWEGSDPVMLEPDEDMEDAESHG